MDPGVRHGSIILNNPIDLISVDFTKIDACKNGKENVLVMMDISSKFSMAAVTPDQQAKVVMKALVTRQFHSYGISVNTHNEKGKSFTNDFKMQLCKSYSTHKSTTMPYYPWEFTL